MTPVDFMFPFLWGLIVLSAFIGWGIAGSRLFGAAPGAGQATGKTDPPGTNVDWGLAAGWGMAALLALGGVLSLSGLALPPVLFAVVAAGVAMHLVAAFKERASWEKPSGLFLLMVAIAALPLLTRYVSVVSYQAMSCGDDDVAYFTYVSRLLQTGTLIEPYGLRRLSTFGGQTFLQSLVVMAGSELNAYLMDRGIAYIVSFGLVAGYLRGQGFGLAFSHLVGLILAVILPLPLLNSSSHVTGLVMFLTLFRTLERLPGPIPDVFPAAGPLWLVGMVAAGASSLKAHFLGVAAVTIFAYWLFSHLQEPRGNEGGNEGRNEGGKGTGRHAAWGPSTVSLGHLGLSSLLFLAPWMGLLYRSSGTVLFPFIQGNHRPGFAESYSGAMPFPELLGFMADFFTAPQVLLFFVPMGLYLFRRGSPAGLALYAGALVTAAVTVSTLTFDNLETLHRYVAPFLNAAFIATVIVFLRDILGNAPDKSPVHPGRKLGDGILVVLVVVLLPVPITKDINRLTHGGGKQAVRAETRVAYATMQAAVPVGERVLAALDRPYWLDYKRNDILNIDVPGAVSPDPGMPFFQGPQPLKDFLLGQSIPFVAFRDFDDPQGCLYRRIIWDFYAKSSHPMWRAESKFFLDFMDNVQALAKTEALVFQRNGLSVIRLR